MKIIKKLDTWQASQHMHSEIDNFLPHIDSKIDDSGYSFNAVGIINLTVVDSDAYV